MAASSESDDESFVDLGRPLPFQEEAGKKPTLTLQDAVRPSQDSKGRPRFHGAFTGGFSAGFFNTAGSKEGWSPASFTSSRKQKKSAMDQKPEDFMDEEDFGEHGIAPRRFGTSDVFSSEEQNRKRRADALLSTRDTILPASAALADLIVPERLPIGIKLLRKMGWKEGQGIGPRERRRKGKKQRKAGKDPGVKVYGCPLPPASDEENESDDGDLDIQNVTFAPKDVAPISFTSKDNVHGLGYSGLDPRSALPGSSSGDYEPPAVRKGRKGIRGQAFGVGALEDPDEDIYAMDSLSNYDQTMELDDSEHLFGWTAPSARTGKKKGTSEVPVSYVGKLLEGFTLSSKPLPKKKVFPAPPLPQGFRPIHRFKKTVQQLVHEATGSKPAESTRPAGQQRLNAVERGAVLGEAPVATSVFDLIPKNDISKMEAIKEAAKMAANRFQSAGAINEASRETHTAVPPSGDADPLNGSGQRRAEDEAGPAAEAEGTDQAPLFSGAMTFKPFHRDAFKQARYEKYLGFVKQGLPDNTAYDAVISDNMTEWERHREKEEFTKAAKIYRPLSNMMASRFTRGTFIDDPDQPAGAVQTTVEKSEEAKAAEMKMYGRLTRKDVEWHPHNLLCKRFNVPNPFPESDIVGVPGLKRDKFSVFNFLSVPSQDLSRHNSKPQSQPKAKETTNALTLELNASKRKKGALSIFSVLDDETESAKSTTVLSKQLEEDDEEESAKDKSKEKDDEDDASDDGLSKPLDLFRAIFKNSDSESSSESDKSDKESDVDENDNDSDTPRKDEEQTTHVSQSSEPAGEEKVDSVSNRAQSERQLVSPQYSREQAERELVSPQYSPSDPTPALPIVPASKPVPKPKKRSRWDVGAGSIFDVLDQEPSPAPQEEETTDDGLKERLSPPVAENVAPPEEYGPALPPLPAATVSPTSSVTTTPVIDLTSKSHRKHKHKDHVPDDTPKHRHKKEKKKKSKHKKEKKKKEKKKSKRSHSSRRQRDSSGSDADSETDSNS